MDQEKQLLGAEDLAPVHLDLSGLRLSCRCMRVACRVSTMCRGCKVASPGGGVSCATLTYQGRWQLVMTC
jgi:hypothetical protein